MSVSGAKRPTAARSDAGVMGPGLPGSESPAHEPSAADGTLSGARLILSERLFFSEYEPVISLHTGRVVGYEALARFIRPDGAPLSPASMFAMLHADPALLLDAEVALKRHQMAHAPPGAELFLNVDPDSWAAGEEAEHNPLLELLAGSATGHIVIEVIENMDDGDASLAREMIGVLRARGLRYALDDVGAQNSLLSFEALDDADVLKFDRILLRRLGHPRRRAVIRALAQVARETGARTVLEGVESIEDLKLAQDLEVDLVQGWFFKQLRILSPRPANAPPCPEPPLEDGRSD